MSKRMPTPPQTVGPFFSAALLPGDAACKIVARAAATGERIRIEGCVYDGDRAPVPDALLEIWQANASGRYNHPADQRPLPLDPAFTGFGQSGTDDAGEFWFETVKPGRVPFEDGSLQAPHIVVTVFARGLLNHAVTRLYFEDEAANTSDPILALVPLDRQRTLLARRANAAGRAIYRFDIVLQGAGETVFFQV